MINRKSPLQIILGVHLHQPVGNFGWVMEESFARAYRPFLETWQRFPSIRLVWHCSGFLLNWLAEHQPGYLAELQQKVRDGQLEIFTGGLYEPIFPMIPPRDRQEQIHRLTCQLEDMFGSTPQGAWLAERVWEPALAADLAAAGVRYVALDDYHFFAAGFTEPEVDGYFIVDELDRHVGVFPISEKMRYLIPWVEPDEVMAEFRRMHAQGRRLAVMMDDAEKFGAWPQTHAWVYEKRWLERFFSRLEEQPDLVRTTTFREYHAAHAPAGRAALPMASYEEMGQWALPPASAQAYYRWKKRFEEEGTLADLQPFFRGGIWRNFLVRYPEANYLQKRILQVSAGFTDDARRATPAYDALLRSQCNDVFWHGVFGGLYFPHLRHQAYAGLLEAQQGLDQMAGRDFSGGPEIRMTDFDQDGREEVIVDDRDAFLVVVPGLGGGVREWSFKPRRVNLLAALSRWEEKYHQTAQATGAIRIEAPDVAIAGESLALFFDRTERVSARERVYAHLPQADELESGLAEAAASFWDTPFRLESAAGQPLAMSARQNDFTLVKSYTVTTAGTRLDVVYDLQGPDGFDGWLGIEWTLGLAGPEDARLVGRISGQPATAFALDERRNDAAVSRLEIVNARDGYCVAVSVQGGCNVALYPIHTVSLAIDRMEKTFQGLAVCLLIPVRDGRCQSTVTLMLEQEAKRN
ncbi:MAG: DUF1926 domain-containing protein [Acidobacteria bacterium]|nr:DUF1926 domain-containing protein [Acidobacteriota bacterium]